MIKFDDLKTGDRIEYQTERMAAPETATITAKTSMVAKLDDGRQIIGCDWFRRIEKAGAGGKRRRTRVGSREVWEFLRDQVRRGAKIAEALKATAANFPGEDIPTYKAALSAHQRYGDDLGLDSSKFGAPATDANKTRVCDECGGVFVPRKTNSRYCSKKCAGLARHAAASEHAMTAKHAADKAAREKQREIKAEGEPDLVRRLRGRFGELLDDLADAEYARRKAEKVLEVLTDA